MSKESKTTDLQTIGHLADYTSSQISDLDLGVQKKGWGLWCCHVVKV